jgi:hypothetical protein
VHLPSATSLLRIEDYSKTQGGRLTAFQTITKQHKLTVNGQEMARWPRRTDSTPTHDIAGGGARTGSACLQLDSDH